MNEAIDPNEMCETIAIEANNKGGYVLINKEDFDKKTMKEFSGKQPEAEVEAAHEKPVRK